MSEIREHFDAAHNAIAEAANATQAVVLERDALADELQVKNSEIDELVASHNELLAIKLEQNNTIAQLEQQLASCTAGGPTEQPRRPFTIDIWGQRPEGAPLHPAVRYFHFPRDSSGNMASLMSSTAKAIGQRLGEECAGEERPVICLRGAGDHGLFDHPQGTQAGIAVTRGIITDVMVAYRDAGGPDADWQFDSERWISRQPPDVDKFEWAYKVMGLYDDGVFAITRGFHPEGRICNYDFDRRWKSQRIDAGPWRGGTHYAPHFYAEGSTWKLTAYVEKWAEFMLDNRVPCLPWLLRPGQRDQSVATLVDQVDFLRDDPRWRCEGVQLWGDGRVAELSVADVEGIVEFAEAVNA